AGRRGAGGRGRPSCRGRLRGCPARPGGGSGMTAARPRYRERQVVQSDDLTAQQAYLTRMRRRHELGQHRWGVVTGLELAVAPGGFTILAGLAVDGMGRQLVVADPVVLPESLFDQLGANRLDLWLRYRRVAESPAGPGDRDCG